MSNRKGSVRYECVTCDVQGRNKYFVERVCERNRVKRICCPKCGSTGVLLSKQGAQSIKRTGQLGSEVYEARKEAANP